MELFRLLEPLIVSLIGAGGGVQFMLTRWEKKQAKKKKEKSNLESMVMALSQDRIVHLCDVAIEEEGISTDTKAVIEELYEPYKAAGGNHVAKSKFEAMRKLPFKE